MNFYAISALVNLVTSAGVGIFVLIKNPHGKVHRNFSYFCLAAAIWSFGYIFWQMSESYEQAYFWCRVLMTGAIITPLFYFTFAVHFTNLEKRKRYQHHIIFAYIILFSFAAINVFTPLITETVVPRLFFPFWPVGGPLFIPFLFFFFCYIFFASFLLIRYYVHSTGIRKQQAKYMVSSLGFAFIAGSTNYFLWFNIPFPPIFTVLVSVYALATGYAITRYRFLDIRVIVRKIVIIIITTIIELAILSIVLKATVFSENTFTEYLAIDILAAAMIYIFVFIGLYASTKKLADFIWKVEKIDISRIFEKEIRVEKPNYSLEEFYEKVRIFLREKFSIDGLEFWIIKKSDGEIAYSTSFKNKKILSYLPHLPCAELCIYEEIEHNPKLSLCRRQLEDVFKISGRNIFYQKTTIWGYNFACFLTMPKQENAENIETIRAILSRSGEIAPNIFFFQRQLNYFKSLREEQMKNK